MGQMWCANTLSLSSQLAPRVQYARPVFVRAEWHGDLWSVKPPCLWRIPAFTSVFPVFNSVAWWHTVPASPRNGSGALWQRTEGRATLWKKGNKAMNEKSGQKGKVSHRALSVWHPLQQTSRRHCRARSEGRGHGRSIPVQFISEGNPINNSGFSETYFLFLESKHENTLKQGDVYFRLELSLQYLLPGWFAVWIDV